MEDRHPPSSTRSARLGRLTIGLVVLLASCAADTASQDEVTRDEEAQEDLENFSLSSETFFLVKQSNDGFAVALAEDDLEPMKNNLVASYDGPGPFPDHKVFTGAGVDWTGEMVLMVMTDACQPSDFHLDIGPDSVEVFATAVSETAACESLSSYAALFIVPTTINTESVSFPFDADSVPTRFGRPLIGLPASDPTGIPPVALVSHGWRKDQERPNDRATVLFAQYPDEVDERVAGALGLDPDDEWRLPSSLQYQADSVNSEDELFVVVAVEVCAALSFQLVPTDDGFLHRSERASVDCPGWQTWTVAYRVPNDGNDALPFGIDNQPIITFETIEA